MKGEVYEQIWWQVLNFSHFQEQEQYRRVFYFVRSKIRSSTCNALSILILTCERSVERDGGNVTRSRSHGHLGSEQSGTKTSLPKLHSPLIYWVCPQSLVFTQRVYLFSSGVTSKISRGLALLWKDIALTLEKDRTQNTCWITFVPVGKRIR